MLSGTFQKYIKRLNPELKIACGNDNTKPAGLFLYKFGEEINICGIDKNFIPEHSIFDDYGHMIKSGWRRPITILISLKLVNRKQAENLFSTKFDKLERKHFSIISAINKALNDAETRKINNKFRTDDIVDIGGMIKNVNASFHNNYRCS